MTSTTIGAAVPAGAAARFDPFDPSLHDDPYPRYAAARAAAAVCRGPHGMSVLTRHRDVSAALRDRRLGHGSSGASALLFSFLGMDPPRHGPLRRIAARFLGPPAVDALAPRVRGLVDGLLDRALQERELDLLTGLAYPVSLTVICGLFGLPERDRTWIQATAPPIGRLLDPPRSIGDADHAAARTAAAAFLAYLHARVRERRRAPGEDIISRLLAEPDLDRRDLVPMCALLILSGYETTANLVANSAATLLARPGEHAGARARVRDGRLDRTALDELIRFDPSVQITFRTVLSPLSVAGTALPVGSPVALLLGSANRDPRVFARPDRLDLDRNPNPHLAFGAGLHYCLGGPLARLEAAVALGRLLDRTRHLALAAPGPRPGAGGADAARGLRHRNLSASLRGLAALPVVLTPR